MAELINKTDNLNKGREKLNDAINQSNTAFTEAQQAQVISEAAKILAESVQEQFNQVVIDGDSSVEAAQARVDSGGTSHPTLKSRLDNFEVSATRQLAHKPNRTEVLTKNEGVGLNNAKPDLLAAIQNKEGESTFNLLSIPRPKSVTPEKTTFIEEVSLNKIDKSRLVDGAYLDGNDNEVSNPGFLYSDYYISMEPNESFSFYGVTRVNFYDENHLIKESLTFNAAEGNTIQNRSDSTAIRVNVGRNYLSQARLNKGTTLMDYEDYKLPKLKHVAVDLTEGSVESRHLTKKAVNVEHTDFIELPNNLFPSKDILEGYYVDRATGNLVANSQYSCTGFMEVPTNAEYTVRRLTAVVRFNKNQELISNLSFTDTSVGTTFNTLNGELVRFNFRTEHLKEAQVNKGSQLLEYDPPYARLSKDIHVSSIPPEQNEPIEPKKSTFYFVPQEIGGYYEPTDTLGFDLFKHGTTVGEYHDAWEDLVNRFPGVLSRKEWGKDASGLYPVYEYQLKPERLPVARLDQASTRKTVPKLLIVSGVHGEEKSSIFSTFYLIRDILENWQTNPVLEYLRWNVELKIIPLANPWGLQDGTGQTNYNGVNINRNFALNHSVTDPSSQLYGGTHPFSEVESLYIRDFVDENLDAIYFGDYHTNGSSGSNYHDLLWHPNPNHTRYEQLDIASRQIIELSTRKFIERYDMPSDEGFFGYVNYTQPPRVSSYAEGLGIPAHTFECYTKLPNQTVYFNPTAIKGCTEYLGNWLATVLKTFKQFY